MKAFKFAPPIPRQLLFLIAVSLSCVTPFISAQAFSQSYYSAIAFYPYPLSDQTVTAPKELTLSPLADQAKSEHLDYNSNKEFLEASAEQYRKAISEAENSAGPYNPIVAEQAEALGDILAQTNDTASAIQAYEKGLHVLRVNNGLYSENQIPLMRKLIAIQLSGKNYQRAHELQTALLYLQKRVYQKSDPGYIAALVEWADWNVDRLMATDPTQASYSSNQAFILNENLFAAQDNYIEAIELIRTSTSETIDRRLIHAEKKLAALNYIANTKSKSSRAAFASFPQSGSQFNGNSDFGTDAEMAYFFNGSSALKRAISYCLESTQPDYLYIAEQMMALGDWYLLFERRSAALAIYEDTFEMLDAAGATQDDIDRIMSPGMPVKLPDTGESSFSLAGNDYQGYIDVEFRVSKYGIATHPEVIGTSKQVSPVTQALIRKIRQERFRPAFEDGSATSKENVKLRYYYSYN